MNSLHMLIQLAAAGWAHAQQRRVACTLPAQRARSVQRGMAIGHHEIPDCGGVPAAALTPGSVV